MLELSQQVEVDTPRGRGRLFLVTDYGSEIEKIFTVALYDGYMFEFPIDKLRLTANITMSRTPQNTSWRCKSCHRSNDLSLSVCECGKGWKDTIKHEHL